MMTPKTQRAIEELLLAAEASYTPWLGKDTDALTTRALWERAERLKKAAGKVRKLLESEAA